MTYSEAVTFLEKHGQSHLLDFWEWLDTDQQRRLLSQIESLDWQQVARMREMLTTVGQLRGQRAIRPAPVISLCDAERNAVRRTGEQAISSGEVAVVLVAGGQGSRLGFEGPKGCFPIGPISRASLFWFHARKILALERRYGTRLPFYIMTSKANDTETRHFFETHHYFGLSPERVIFFRQGMWPALWPDGRLVLEKPDRIFMSPDGHGGILTALDRTGALDDMVRRGIRTIFYFQVDNPLVNVADPVFIGLHIERDAEVSLKVCAKRDPSEPLGVFVEENGKHAIVEYSELSGEQKAERTPDGLLKFRFGSVAIHVFSLEFLQREIRRGLPLHIAHKKVPFCGNDGRTIQPTAPNAYKFEKFIFDVLPDAERVVALEFLREDEFSPVKNASGEDSPATAQRDMIRKWARWLESCNVKVPRNAFKEPAYRIEIDPCFANSADELKARLKGIKALEKDLLLQAS